MSEQLKPVTYDNALANMVMLLKFGTSEEAGYAIEVYRQQVCEQERVRIERLIRGMSCDAYCIIHDERYDLPCNCLRGDILAEIAVDSE